MDHEEEQLSVHYAAAYYDDFRGKKKGYVQAELREVKGYEAPNARIVLDVGQRGKADFQPICDGFVADHAGKTGSVFMVWTGAFEVFVLIRRSFHPKSYNIYMICPPSGCRSP